HLLLCQASPSCPLHYTLANGLQTYALNFAEKNVAAASRRRQETYSTTGTPPLRHAFHSMRQGDFSITDASDQLFLRASARDADANGNKK
ncbi:MAG: hypothetical protein IJJ33_03585, partial [Victivallales bacterium]|nr:hypothetical protein [Victivallales bacterium]